tara:strand:- start:7185 stop:7697 length:513 start_codon:yes stop_codon:yes gene_type:complete
MSLLNITYSDFGKGKYELHSGMYEQTKIDSYIDKYEKQYLIKLLGVELYKLFIADLVNGVPQTTKYLDLYNPFEYDDSTCWITISEGMVDMVKGFIYFQYLKDQTNQVAVSGNVRPLGENSENVSTLNSMIYTRYNESVKTFKAIQRFICDNNSNYLDYNGISIRLANWI